MPAMESYQWTARAVVIVIVNDMVEPATMGRTPKNGKNDINWYGWQEWDE